MSSGKRKSAERVDEDIEEKCLTLLYFYLFTLYSHSTLQTESEHMDAGSYHVKLYSKCLMHEHISTVYGKFFTLIDM